MSKLATIYFRKSTSGFQVLAKIDRDAPLGVHHGLLDNGREMTSERSLEYAQRYIASRKSAYYEFVIDKSSLTEEKCHVIHDSSSK